MDLALLKGELTSPSGPLSRWHEELDRLFLRSLLEKVFLALSKSSWDTPLVKVRFLGGLESARGSLLGVVWGVEELLFRPWKLWDLVSVDLG